MRNYRLRSLSGVGHVLRERSRRGLSLLAGVAAAAAAWWDRVCSRRIPARLRSYQRLVRYAPLVVVPAVVAAVALPLLPDAGGHGRLAGPFDDLMRPARYARPAPLSQRPVTLVTGDTARLTPVAGGRSEVSVKPRRGVPASGFADTFQIGGDVYAVPGAALPFFGSLLDPRFFDVSYLQRAGYAGLKSLPVRISWRQPEHSAIPGVSGPSTGSRTSGSVRLATASTFGQALSGLLRAKSAARADAAAAAGSGGALAEVKRISLGPVPSARTQPGAAGSVMPGVTPAHAPAAVPAVPVTSGAVPAGTSLHTLTVNVLDRAGQPGYALLAVQNLDDFQRFHSVYSSAFWWPWNETTSYGLPQNSLSVPDGRYGVEAIIFDVDWHTGILQNFSFVPADVRVSADTAITLDAREAKPINISVPRDATTAEATMGFARQSANHGGLSDLFIFFGPGTFSVLPPLRMFAKPTAAPRIGTLSFEDNWELTPPGTDGFFGSPAYSYSLSFASADGVPAGLSHDLTASDLAAVHERYASPASGDSVNPVATPFVPWSPLAFSLFPVVFWSPAPAERVDYFGGSSSTLWRQEAALVPPNGYYLAQDGLAGAYRTFRPGEDLTATWFDGPLVPKPEMQTVVPPAGPVGAYTNAFAPDGYLCPSCRQGNAMSFNVPRGADNDPTHNGGPFSFGSYGFPVPGSLPRPSEDLRFYRDGVLVARSPVGLNVFPMVPGKASYRLEWASSNEGVPWTVFGTRVNSVWTFTSAQPAKPGGLPAPESCTPAVIQPCAYIPLIFARYDFGADLRGRVAAPGTETFTLTGYHQPGEDGPAVTGAAVQVSFDDGATWAPAAEVTSLGGGRFRVAVTQPAPSASSGFASLKVSLSDAAGGTLTQTVIRAYALASPAAASAPSPATAKITSR